MPVRCHHLLVLVVLCPLFVCCLSHEKSYLPASVDILRIGRCGGQRLEHAFPDMALAMSQRELIAECIAEGLQLLGDNRKATKKLRKLVRCVSSKTLSLSINN